MARELFRFGSGSEKLSRHSEKILAPLFPKTRAAIRAFPVCELPRGGFVRKGKFGRFRGTGSYKNIMGDNCRELPPYISKNIRSEEIISLFECTHLPTNSCHPLGGVL
nr:hypothetical protein [Porphyromonas gingivalis]